MGKVIAVAFCLLMCVSVFADQDDIPVLNGVPVKVLSVKLVVGEVIPSPDPQRVPPYHADLVATVQYDAGCVPATSLVVVKPDGSFNYRILETLERFPPSTVHCDMIRFVKKDVRVDQFFGEQPDIKLLNINGVGVDQ